MKTKAEPGEKLNSKRKKGKKKRLLSKRFYALSLALIMILKSSIQSLIST